MVPRGAALVLGVLAVALPACKKDASGFPLELVPRDATVVVGIDVEALRRSPHARLFEPLDPGLAGFPNVAPCVPQREWTRVLFGVEAGLGNRMVIVEARDAGTRKTADCIAAHSWGEPPVSHSNPHAVDMGPWSAILWKDDYLILTTVMFRREVLETLYSTRPSVRGGPLEQPLAHADQTRPAWAAGLGLEWEDGGLQNVLGFEAEWFTVTADAAVHLTVEAHAGSADPERDAEVLRARWTPAEARLLRDEEVPRSFVSSVGIDAQQGSVRVSARLRRTELEGAKTLLPWLDL